MKARLRLRPGRGGPAITAAILVVVAAGAHAADPARSTAPRSVSSSGPRPVVRLVVPTLPGFLELTVLTRAELTAAGFEVQERAIPAGDSSAWLAEARRDEALAAVILGGSRAAPAARIWLLGPAKSDRPHELQSPPSRRPSEGLILRARTTLAVRIAEHVLQHHTFTRQLLDGDAAANGPRQLEPGPVVAPPGLVPRAPPAPAQRVQAAARPGLAASEASALAGNRIELAVLAGQSLHPEAPSLGIDLGYARLSARRRFVHVGLSARTPIRALSAVGGTVRGYEAAAWTGVGLEGAMFWRRLAPEIAIDLGLQHTRVIGRAAQGFEGHSVGSWSPLLAGNIGLVVQLGPHSTALLGMRVFHLFAPPTILIDETTVSRDSPNYEGRLSLRLTL
jgi:hypothetical protein